MGTPAQNSSDLLGLVERIQSGDCVLVLGPRVAVRPGDPERRPLEDVLAVELLQSIDESVPPASSVSLRRAADVHYRKRHDRAELNAKVRVFYEREGQTTTEFHRDLARLPFRLCICASPDTLMFNAFAGTEGKTPVKGTYNFRQAQTPRLPTPTEQKPIIYHLFGQYDDPKSLVLTEGDLIEFLVAIVRETPKMPDEVRYILADKQNHSFLFVGFGFHNWYLRVLLQVLQVYGHQDKAIALEDSQFFDHPEHEQVVGFFSGERLIEFRPLQWDTFARDLRDAYETTRRKKPAPAATAAVAAPEGSPLAFISYAGENRERVEELMAKLHARNIRVWQDKQNLRAGDKWNEKLMRTIRKVVDYVIVLQTEEMLSRTEGIFHREIKEAQARQDLMSEVDGEQLRFLIPVKCGNCGILSALEDAHVIDIDEPGGADALADSILEDWTRRAGLRSRPKAVD